MLEIGVYEFIKKIKGHILSAVLLSIVMLIIVLSSCILEKNYGKYDIFSKYMDHKGMTRTSYDLFTYALGMENGLSDVKEKFAIKHGKILGINGNMTESGEIILYDDNIISHFAPILLEGEWLDQYTDTKNFIPCVISENGLGIGVGDVYEIDDSNCKLVVVGIIRDGAEILGYGDIWHITDNDYECFYRVFSHEKTLDHVVIVPQRYEQQLAEISLMDFNSSIIIYEDDISEETINSNIEIARNTGNGIDLTEFKSNSLRKVYNSMSMYLPVSFATVIICLITIAVITLLHFRNSQGNLGIYQLCGMNYKHCFVLNTIPTIATGGLAILLSSIGYVLMKTYAEYNYRPYISGTQIILVLGVLLIYVIIYQMVFMWLYIRSSLKTKLKERGSMT